MRTPALSLLLFLSGAGALVLEVGWFRRMAQVAGATSVAMAGVLAAVIGGMALGSFWLGGRADRVRRPLALYGWLEAGVAAAALASPWLLTASQPLFDALPGGLPGSLARFALASVLLAPPAVLMGGTLPAAACALRIEPGDRGRALGTLYACNTLGAVAGTLLMGFFLMPRWGLPAMRFAAVCAGGAAAIALLRATPREDAGRAGGFAAPSPEARRAILLSALSGFLGFVAEVAFFRDLVLVFGATTYAFTVMLAVFLLGIGLGGAWGARLARRREGHMRLLENTLAATAACFALAALLVYALPRLYLIGIIVLGEDFATGLVLRACLAALVLLPGTIGLGVAFPLAAHVCTAGSMGAGTGRLYGFNTLASIAGSTAAVFLLVPLLGPHHAVAIVAVAVAAIVAATARRAAPAVLALAAAVGLLPPSAQARERLLAGVYFVPQAFLTNNRIDEKTWAEGVDIPYHAWGREATVAVWRWYGTNSVLIDGKAVATNQVLADDHHLSLLGHVPMAMHPDPQRVLVVGLGMGTTYRAVALHAPALVRVVELEEAVLGAAERLGNRPDDVVINDARSYLRSTDETFDVITSDPIHPWVRGGGDLYTIEYFESCRDRLGPDGVACQWLPVYQMGVPGIEQMVRTFTTVFPHAAAFYGGGDLVLVGSVRALGEPRRFEGPVAEALAGLGAEDLAVLQVAGGERLRAAGGPDVSVLRDPMLRLEFAAPRFMDNHAMADAVAWVRRLWGKPPPPFAELVAALEARYRDDAAFRGHLDRALHEHPKHPYVRRFAGETWLDAAGGELRAGAYAYAEQALRRAAALLGDDPRLLGTEADLREAQGRKAEAAHLLRELLARDPDSAYLKRRLAALE